MINEPHDTIHMYIHNHPRMENNHEIDDEHCIIDKKLFNIIYDIYMFNPILSEYIKNKMNSL